jgi:hypothetical protein
MISYLIAFAVSFSLVGLKALQQLNVFHHKVLWIMPVSLGLGLAEVLVIGLAVENGLWIALPIGVGGGLGCILAMKLHKRWRN